jgi:hypothetical protein
VHASASWLISGRGTTGRQLQLRVLGGAELPGRDHLGRSEADAGLRRRSTAATDEREHGRGSGAIRRERWPLRCVFCRLRAALLSAVSSPAAASSRVRACRRHHHHHHHHQHRLLLLRVRAAGLSGFAERCEAGHLLLPVSQLGRPAAQLTNTPRPTDKHAPPRPTDKHAPPRLDRCDNHAGRRYGTRSAPLLGGPRRHQL